MGYEFHALQASSGTFLGTEELTSIDPLLVDLVKDADQSDCSHIFGAGIRRGDGYTTMLELDHYMRAELVVREMADLKRSMSACLNNVPQADPRTLNLCAQRAETDATAFANQLRAYGKLQVYILDHFNPASMQILRISAENFPRIKAALTELNQVSSIDKLDGAKLYSLTLQDGQRFLFKGGELKGMWLFFSSTPSWKDNLQWDFKYVPSRR